MAPTLEELYTPIRGELRMAQARVAELWGEALQIVHGPSMALPKAGGKLMRPAMCLLAAGSTGTRDIASVVEVAVACELLHVAALTHDDVVDNADLRRGAKSLNALWDDKTAVLGGDFLVARALGILTTFGSCELLASTLDAIRRMTEGELASLGHKADRFTQEDCVRLAEDKTATLFAATCTAPTHLIGGEYRGALHEYGVAFGIAFQLVDDILDIMRDKSSLGKPSCGDIVEGKKTLPILFMREGMDEADRRRLHQMLGRTISDRDRAWAASAMDATGARAKTEAVARQYVDAAQRALEPLPPSPYKDSLAGLTEFVLIRGS